jgi:hypothetical protein
VNKLKSPVGHPDGLSLTLERMEKSDGQQAIGKGQHSVESLSQNIEVFQRCAMLYIYQDLFPYSLPVMMICLLDDFFAPRAHQDSHATLGNRADFNL